jgi:hypothetical protein
MILGFLSNVNGMEATIEGDRSRGFIMLLSLDIHHGK